MPNAKIPQTDKLPGFIRSSTENHGSSNPTPGAFRSTQRVFIQKSWSVIVVMSSEAAPSNVGAVSAFMLGFSIGIGGRASLGFGGVADLLGLHSAFQVFAGFAVTGGFLALFLPKRAFSAIYSR